MSGAGALPSWTLAGVMEPRFVRQGSAIGGLLAADIDLVWPMTPSTTPPDRPTQAQPTMPSPAHPQPVRRHLTHPVNVGVLACFVRDGATLDSTIALDLALWEAAGERTARRLPSAEVRAARHAVEPGRGLHVAAGEVRVVGTEGLRPRLTGSACGCRGGSGAGRAVRVEVRVREPQTSRAATGHRSSDHPEGPWSQHQRGEPVAAPAGRDAAVEPTDLGVGEGELLGQA